MSVLIFIQCTRPGCGTVQPTDAQEVAAARIAARLAGWQSTQRWDERQRKQVTDDFCPEHLPQRMPGAHPPADLHHRIARGDCPLGSECWARNTTEEDQAAVYDWCGHDMLGHRMANILLRDGIKTVADLVDADASALLDLRGFGTLCITRWELFKEADRAA